MVTEKKRLGFRLGPGLMVTAAFVGPGTVVTASKAGIQTGCSLLWVVVLAGIAAIVLQSFAASLGIRTKGGLSEYLRRSLMGSPLLWPMIALVIAAIGIGNAAYQTGNLLGAAAGLAEAFGGGVSLWALAIASAAAFLIFRGRIELLRWGLGGLVALMSLTFLASAFAAWPGFGVILEGISKPTFEQADYPLVLALVGTTVVPYNLFLHASTAATRWKDVDREPALWQAFLDTALSITLGIIVTGAIVVSASLMGQSGDAQAEISSNSISGQLRPLLGDYATVLFSLGLFAAGMTSSLTAPLATAYAVTGLLGLAGEDRHNSDSRESSPIFRLIAISVIVIGAAFAVSLSKAPVQAIVLAQVANGLLLPVVATALMWAATKATSVKQPSAGIVRSGLARSGLVRVGGLALGWTVVTGVSLLSVYRLYSIFS